MGNLKIVALSALCTLISSVASATLKGTVYLTTPDEFKEPSHVHISVQLLNDEQIKVTVVNWNQCDKAKKTCPYMARKVPGQIGQYCKVGIKLRYVSYIGRINATTESQFMWASERVLLTANESKQDIGYDITQTHPTIRLLHEGHDKVVTSSAKETTNTGNKKMVTVNVQGTVEFVNTGFPFRPKTINIHPFLQFDGQEYGSKDSDMWVNSEDTNKAAFIILDVHGSVDQTYKIGINTSTSKFALNNFGLVWSNNSLALKAADNKVDIKYDTYLNTFTLTAVSDTASSSSTSTLDSSSLVTQNKKHATH